MISISTLDWIIVAVYLLSMLGVGFYFSNRIKTSTDYFLGGRTLGWFPIGCSMAATVIGGAAMLGRTGTIYSKGLAGVTVALPYFLGMVLLGFIMPRISKVGVKNKIGTLPGLFGYRYGKKMQFIIGLFCAIGMGASVATQISGCATVFHVMGGDKLGISFEAAAAFATIIFIVYVLFSGLFSVVWTDVIQCIMLVIFIYILLPIGGIKEAGGWANIKSVVPETYWNWNFDASIITAMVTNFAIVACNTPMWQRAFSAKTSGTAKKGMIFGYAIYGCTIFLTIFIAFAALALIPGIKETYGSTDSTVPALVVRILPKGIIGLTVAGMLAVSMSSGDSQLLCAMQHFTSDCMKVVKPEITTKEEIKWGRISCVFFGLLGLALALWIKGAYNVLITVWGFYSSCMACPSIAALLWRKATKQGVLAGVFTGLGANLIWTYLLNKPFGFAGAIPGIILNGIVLVIVSLITYDPKNPPKFAEYDKGEITAVNVDVEVAE